MIIEIIRCDRCGDAITGNEYVHRYVTDYFRFDLCKKCDDELHVWLTARNADQDNRPDEASGEESPTWGKGNME